MAVTNKPTPMRYEQQLAKHCLGPPQVKKPLVSVAIEKAKNADGTPKSNVDDVFILKAASGEIVSRAEVGTNTFGTVFYGNRQFATDTDSSTLKEIDVNTGEVIGALEFSVTDPKDPAKTIKLEPHQPDVGPDGKLYVPLFNAEYGHRIAIVDTKGGLQQVGEIDLGPGRQPHILSTSPDGTTLYGTVQNAQPAIVQFDLTSPEMKMTVAPVPSVPRVIAATNVGAFFTAFGVEGVLFMPKGKTTTELVHKDPLAFNPKNNPYKLFEGIATNEDGSLLAATRDDGSNRVLILRRNAAGSYDAKIHTLDSKPYYIRLNGDLAYVTMQETGKVIALDTRIDPDEYPGDVLAWDTTLVEGRPAKRAAVGGQ